MTSSAKKKNKQGMGKMERKRYNGEQNKGSATTLEGKASLIRQHFSKDLEE